jgi:hypothetical protein
MRMLLQAISAVSNLTAAWDEETGEDLRDYRTIGRLVHSTLRAHLGCESTLHVSPAHVEGFVRALSDFLCINTDGCGMSARDAKEWDPIQNTAYAFAGHPMGQDAH